MIVVTERNSVLPNLGMFVGAGVKLRKSWKVFCCFALFFFALVCDGEVVDHRRAIMT